MSGRRRRPKYTGPKFRDVVGEVRAALEAQGWTVVSRGWPTLLAVYAQPDGTVVMAKGIVVNGPLAQTQLSPAQHRMACLLGQVGLPVEVHTGQGKG